MICGNNINTQLKLHEQTERKSEGEDRWTEVVLKYFVYSERWGVEFIGNPARELMLPALQGKLSFPPDTMTEIYCFMG